MKFLFRIILIYLCIYCKIKVFDLWYFYEFVLCGVFFFVLLNSIEIIDGIEIVKKIEMMYLLLI